MSMSVVLAGAGNMGYAMLEGWLKSGLLADLAASGEMRARGESVEAYDQMIGEGNEAGNATVQKAIDALVDQTRSIERAFAVLDLGAVELEGSDSLDNPDAVFQ